MNYDDFMLTLRDLLGFKLTGDPPTFDEMIATLQRDNSESNGIHAQMCAAVDDLLAEAGYDTLFDTREKCLEALRQDIKAKLCGRPTTAMLAKALGNAMASTFQATGKWGEVREVGVEEMRLLASATLMFLGGDDDYIASGRPTPAARAVDQEGLAKAIYDTNGSKAWPWGLVGPETKADYLAKADAALKYIGATSTADETRARELLSYEVLGLRNQLADAQVQVGLWRDTSAGWKQVADAAQNQLAAERKKWPELKAEVERLTAENKQLVQAMVGKNSSLRAAAEEERRLKLEIQRLREANRELADALVARKPLDRDRVRLALLDFPNHRVYASLINDLADHLVKRLA